MIISESVKYVGVDDTSLDLFEGQYIIPEGISYNSYVVLDEKVAVMDTVDKRCIKQWEENLLRELGDRKVDYLIVQHLEPDHAGSMLRLMELFPEVILVGNVKTFNMLPQFFDVNIDGKTLIVGEGDTLSLGKHTLTFFMAPMVHWPEVMVTYDSKDKILFSADGFGKFGALEKTKDTEWACEARRYYFNIAGKYGAPVQALLKKLATIDVKQICPLHGPVLNENLEYYISLYDTWSSYKPENSGVLVAYSSMHGNTTKAAEKVAELLKEKGVQKVVLSDLSREDMAEVIEDAFRYDRLILAASSYEGGVFPKMQEFLLHLQSKSYQNRKIGIIENGSWAPSAGRTMRGLLDSMKNIEIVEPMVTIWSKMKDSDIEKLEKLAESMK